MTVKLVSVAPVMCLLLGGMAFGQKSKVLEVSAWQGTLTSGVSWEGQVTPTSKGKFRQSISGTFTLEEFDPVLIYWTGFWKSGSITHFDQTVTTLGSCVYTNTTESFGPIIPDSYRHGGERVPPAMEAALRRTRGHADHEHDGVRRRDENDKDDDGR
jgi:hypothetical protein